MAKCSPGYIGQIETAKSPLSSRARAKFAKIFNVDVAEFLRVGDPKTEADKELDALKEELKKYSIENIRRLRKIVHTLMKMMPREMSIETNGKRGKSELK